MSSVLCEEKKSVTKLQIGVKKRVENCPIKSRKGDLLSMHYTVNCSCTATISRQAVTNVLVLAKQVCLKAFCDLLQYNFQI